MVGGWRGMANAGKNPPKRTPPPLERSSYEFMVALMVASFTQLIPDWVAYMVCWIILAGVAIYFCWFSRGTVGYGKWRKFFLSVCCVGFVFSMSYSQALNRYREANIIPPTILYMTQWGEASPTPLSVTGTPPRVIGGIPSSVAVVDGRLLVKYKSKFRLMAVNFHIINNESYMDKQRLCKSKLVKIKPEDIPIKIDFNELYLTELEQGATSDIFILLAMPNGLEPSDFDTLNEAEEKGAQLIGSGGRSGMTTTTLVLPGMPQQR
jgi:hypothetical protein